MSNTQASTAKNSARDYVEIGAAFLIVVGVLFALGQFDLLPKQFGLSTTMSYGLVFVIGLVASVSSCIAVTGGLLVAVAAKYNETTPNQPSPRARARVETIEEFPLMRGATVEQLPVAGVNMVHVPYRGERPHSSI